MKETYCSSQPNTLKVIAKNGVTAEVLLHKDGTYHYQWRKNNVNGTPSRSTQDFSVIVGAFALGSGVRFMKGGSNSLLVGWTMEHVYVNGVDIKDRYPMKRLSDIEPPEEELRSFGLTVLAEIGSVAASKKDQHSKIRRQASSITETNIVEPGPSVPEFTPSERTLENTTIETVIEERRGQQEYRRQLEILWNGRCAVTGCSVRQALRASHAIPWSECRTGAERLDPYNGLLLTANLDALFDAFLITFDMHGHIQISSRLSSEDCALLGISKDMKLRFISEAHRPYLLFHQNRFKSLELQNSRLI